MQHLPRDRSGLMLGGVVLLLGAIAAGSSLLLPLGAWLRALQEFLTQRGPTGYALLFGIQVVGTATIAPSAPFAILAGLMLGPVGFLLAMAGATCGAALAFLASRHAGRQRIERLAARHPTCRALDHAIGQSGWRLVSLMRMSPLIPFNMQSYIFGATRIGFGPYIAATALGIGPNTALCVYLGMMGRDPVGARGPLSWLLIGIELVATAAVIVLASRAATRATRAMMAASADTEAQPRRQLIAQGLDPTPCG